MARAGSSRSKRVADVDRSRYTELQSLTEVDKAGVDLDDYQDASESRQLLSEYLGPEPMESDATVPHSRRPSVASTTLQKISKFGVTKFYENFSRATLPPHPALRPATRDDQSVYALKAEQDDAPTDDEKRTLRRIADHLPWSAFLVAVVELCERFAFYGLSGPFQNYISNKADDPSGLPGALGLDQSSASALTNFFQFLCYVTPLLGAVIADQYLGKYKTIVYFSLLYIIGLIILFITSLPVSIAHGAAFPGLVTAMVVIGLSTGGIKANVSPLIAEQYTETKPRVRILHSGEKVIVDPTVTIQRIYMIFYFAINLGSLGAVATTTIELKVGFWAAYFLPMVMFIVGFFVLISGRRHYVVRPPQGSVLVHASKVVWIAVRDKQGFDAARPPHQRRVNKKIVPWTDVFVDELRRAVVACKVFLLFPIFWACFNQMQTNFVSQAGTMELHGLPNDILQNIDALTLIIFLPIFDRMIYPTMRRVGIAFKPITRICCGFLVGAAGMAYAAGLQNYIYDSGPCYSMPLKCEAAILPDGTLAHQQVHVALQTPAYFLIAIAEIFASVTGLEYAYTKAPASMKSLVMAIFLLMSAFGAAIGVAIAPAAKDPNLTWLYSGLAIAAFASGVVFWLCFHKYNAQEDQMNDLDPSEYMGLQEIPRLPLTAKVSNFDLRNMGVRNKSVDTLGRLPTG